MKLCEFKTYDQKSAGIYPVFVNPEHVIAIFTITGGRNQGLIAVYGGVQIEVMETARTIAEAIKEAQF